MEKQFLGTQLIICTINFLRDLEFFISVGTLSHSFGPVKGVVSMTYPSAHGIMRLNLDGFLRFQGTSANSKTTFINYGVIPVLTLNISVISFQKHLSRDVPLRRRS